MYLNQLTEKYQNKSEMMKLFLNKQFSDWLLQETSFLSKYYKSIPNRIRAYVLVNGITENSIPKCKNSNCNNVSCLNVTYPEKGFREYCGSKCSRSSLKIEKHAQKKLENYNWLHHKRVIEKKSAYVIAKELGVSEFTVSKYIKQYKLNINDLRKPNKNATDILTDKNKLLKLYEQGKTCEDIALLIGSSKATVSKWLNIHEIQIRPSNSYERKNNYTSKEEKEVLNFIENDLQIECLASNRSILNGKEIDILVPKYNLAIEYDGLFSHIYRPWETKESKIKGKNYHVSKTIECEQKGIQLIHIFSDEWEFKKDIVKSIITSKLNQSKRIYARSTILQEVSSYEKNIFLEENHIQGKDKSKIKLGLYYNHNLVSVMTFGTSRFNSNYKWELVRFATAKNLTVVGGFSKLLSHFKKSYSGSIISYADRRYSIGNVYSKNGFKLLKVNLPSYYYVDRKTYRMKYNRMKFQKKLIECNDNQTEYEKARELGFEKIYDCGTLTYGLE